MALDFKFPDIGEGIHEGKVLEWYHKPGDKVKEGDPLLKVETDKVVTDIPVPKTGTLLTTSGAVDEIVHVGQVIAVIGDAGEKVNGAPAKETVHAEIKPAKKEEKTESTDEGGLYGVVGKIPVGNDVMPAATEGRETKSAPAQTNGRKVLATPVARKMASVAGVDIQNIQGTGPGGRVMKDDISRASQSAPVTTASGYKAPAPARLTVPSGGVEIEPLSQLRKSIAARMSQSKYTAVHSTVFEEVEVSRLVAFREQKNKELEKSGIKLTYLPFVIKALCIALKRHKKLNAMLDMEKGQAIYKRFYNIGIAVDTEDGLLVPVIKNADQLSVIELGEAIKDLSTRARERKLALDEIRDGTFTVTNFGSLNGTFGVPVINYPEVAILGVGMIQKKPVIVDDDIVKGYLLPLSLSFDHRLVNGGDSSRFMNDLLAYLREPMNMIMEPA